MPGRAKHVCPERGCTTLIPAGQRHCDRHRRQKAWGGGFRPASRNIPDDVRRRVLARDKYHCQLRYEGCTTQAAHCDHTIPVSEGGTSDESNLESGGERCHLKKSSREDTVLKVIKHLNRERHKTLSAAVVRTNAQQ